MNDLTVEDRLQAIEGQPTASRAEKIDIIEYWRAISKRRWSILALAFLVAVLATLVAFSIRPTYRGTATLLIEPGKTKVLSIEEIYSKGMTTDRDHYYTQVEILKSDELARRVIEKLKLLNHPDFDPRLGGGGWRESVLPASMRQDPKALTDEDALKRVLSQLKADLQVQLVRNSQLVQITFTATDKQLAATVPNTLAEIYIESDLEARMAMTQKATGWMRERMGDLRTKVEASERALQDYRERERIVDAKGVSLSGASKQLEELSRSLVEARQKRAEAESMYQQVQQARTGKTTLETLPAVLRHPLVQKLKEQESDAERKLSDAAKRYGPEHPKMIQAKAELDSARENTRRQMESVVAGVAREYEIARANEASIERALGQSKYDIQSLNRKEFQLSVLEREVAGNRNLYEMFVGRLKETAVGSDFQSTVARVIDPATVPGQAYAPRKSQIVAISFLVALVLGMLLALLLDRLNNTLHSTSDVEHRLSVPVLGVLHKVKGFAKKGFASELAFFNDTQSTFAEAVRTVRTSVLMSGLDHQHKVVVITSSVPEEGKTTLSFNLAGALGQVKKVLLIEADLRRPKVGKLVGRDSKAPGLADLVAGQAQLSDCVFFHAAGGIHIMAAGTVPPNPLELLSARRFEEILEKLKTNFDMIVIDSAPLQLVSDALVLAQYASSVIYVVRADATPYPVAQNGLRRLRRLNAPVIGVVLNQLDLDKAEKYHGEYSGYYSYKGYKKYGYGTSKVYGQT